MAFTAHLSKSNIKLAEANTIFISNLDMAAKNFSKIELNKAHKPGLISDLVARKTDAFTMGHDFFISTDEQ